MNPEIKARWLAALRSGEYTQAKGVLRSEDRGDVSFCCLGVLCELAVTDGVIERDGTDYGVLGDSSDAELPDVVQRWAGLVVGPAVHLPDGICFSPDGHDASGGECNCMAGTLAEANDDGNQNFAQIADLIEVYL